MARRSRRLERTGTSQVRMMLVVHSAAFVFGCKGGKPTLGCVCVGGGGTALLRALGSFGMQICLRKSQWRVA